MNTVNIVVLIVAIVAIAIAGWALLQREKTLKLKRRFGPEYDRVIDQEKNARRAETVLGERQKRVDRYSIRVLSPEERECFASKWRALQEHFVDNPHDAVAQADALVTDAMRTRGYPMTDFEQRAADLSVDHPTVVQDYRGAHEIAVRDTQGSATTEDLRKAMQYYRTLFEHVLDTRVLQHH
jgi:FtsZ-interacting cell division protein ZipA